MNRLTPACALFTTLMNICNGENIALTFGCRGNPYLYIYIAILCYTNTQTLQQQARLEQKSPVTDPFQFKIKKKVYKQLKSPNIS